MAFPSVTYTFVNGTSADATQVDQNFTDLINGASDGTKNYNISAITAGGAATLNGAVTLGLSLSNLITINGSVTSDIQFQADNTYNIGAVTVGLKSAYFGNGAKTVRVMGPAGMGASWTFTLPSSGGTNTYVMTTDGSGNASWSAPTTTINNASNYSITATASASILTITLNAASGSAPTAGNPINVNFRNTSLTSGLPLTATISSAISMTVNSGATLGLGASTNQYVYIYLQYNLGTPELCVSGSNIYDESRQYTTVAVTGGSTSASTLYATTGRSNQPIRLIGRLLVNLASFWAGNPTEISPLVTQASPPPFRGAVYYMSSNFTTTGISQLNFDTSITDTGGLGGGTYVTTGASWKFTAIDAGFYRIGGFICGSYTGSTQLELYINGVADRWVGGATLSGGAASIAPNTIVKLAANDYIDFRPNNTSLLFYGGALSATYTSHIDIQYIGP